MSNVDFKNKRLNKPLELLIFFIGLTILISYMYFLCFNGLQIFYQMELPLAYFFSVDFVLYVLIYPYCIIGLSWIATHNVYNTIKLGLIAMGFMLWYDWFYGFAGYFVGTITYPSNFWIIEWGAGMFVYPMAVWQYFIINCISSVVAFLTIYVKNYKQLILPITYFAAEVGTLTYSGLGALGFGLIVNQLNMIIVAAVITGIGLVSYFLIDDKGGIKIGTKTNA